MSNNTITLNSEQQEAVCTKDNTVLIAGAGSGKTTVLASRVIYLLIDKKIPLKKILCLTHTRKATAEMAERIRTLLRDCIASKSFLAKPLDDNTLSHLHTQEEAFYEAQIMTLDAFSLRIAQIAMNKKGYQNILAVHSDIPTLLTCFISDWLLSHQDSFLLRLLRHKPYQTLIEEILYPVLEDSSCIAQDMETSYNAVYKRIGHLAVETHKTMRYHAQELLACIQSKVADNASDNIARYTDTLKAILSYDDANNQTLDAQALTPQSLERGSIAFPFDIDACNTWISGLGLRGITVKRELKSSADTIKEHNEILKNMLTQAIKIQNSIENKDYYRSVYLALGELIEDWNKHRTEFGLYSYNNIAELARHALLTDPTIKQWYIERYDYIVIDEFQDNNIDQKDLLYALSSNKDQLDNNKYFFVGDPKQSIYKFRGADIQAFYRLPR